MSLAAVAALPACSTPPEESIVAQFFAAARLHDRTALENFATAGFAPNEQGIVTTFEIVAVSPERVTTVDLTGRAPEGAASSASAIVQLSADNPQQPVDLAAYAAQLITKEVTVQAPVRLPDGRTADRTLIVVMQRARLDGERRIDGRWIVTGIRDSAAAGTRRP